MNEDGKQPIAGQRPNRRRNYLINPVFQWKYTLSLATGAFLVTSFMGICMYGYMFRQARVDAINPLNHSSLSNEATILLFAVLFSVIVLTVLCTWGVMITHRISGPLYVLNQNLVALQKGRFPKWRALRDKDEFKDLHNQFYKTSDALRDRMENSRQTIAKALADLSSSQAPAGTIADLQSLHDELAAALDGEQAAPIAEPVDAASNACNDPATTSC